MRVGELREDHLHLLLLGPGYGESVLLRIPPDHWVVVDCFRWRPPGAEGRVPPLEVLWDAGARVAGIVLTHPHDDHAPGLSRVVELAPQAWVACCGPLWLEPPTAAWDDDPDLEGAHRRNSTAATLAAILRAWGTPERRWDLAAGSTRAVGEAKLTALFPDEAARRSPRPPDANRLSTPLLVEWRSLRLVLGADLPAAEWDRIDPGARVNAHQANKVSHHASLGSVTEVLTPSTPGRLWMATPWNRSRKLPRFEDEQGVSRLLRQVEALHLTALPARPSRPLPSRSVTRQQVLEATAPEPDPDLDGLGLEPIGRPSGDLDGWIRASFNAEGEVAELQSGPEALMVTEGHR